MRTTIIALLAALLATVALAQSPPTETHNVRFDEHTADQFHVKTSRGNTPQWQFNLWLDEDTRWYPTNYTAKFFYSTNSLASLQSITNGFSMTNCTVSTSGYCTVTVAASNLTVVVEDGYAALCITSATESHSYARGKITVFDSPELDVPAATDPNMPLDWALRGPYSHTATHGPNIFASSNGWTSTTDSYGRVYPVLAGAVTNGSTGVSLGGTFTGDGSGLTGVVSGAGIYLAISSNLSDLASAATARTNLSLVPGTHVQAWDADLDDLADGSLTPSKVGISAFGQTLVDDADAATARGTMGLGTAATNAAGAFVMRDGSLKMLGSLLPNADSVDLGDGSFRWGTVYGIAGSFSGTLTASNLVGKGAGITDLSGAAIAAAGGLTNAAAFDAAGSATAVSNALAAGAAGGADWLSKSNTVVYTNDSRLTDARTPTAHDQWAAGTGLTNAGTSSAPTGTLNAASVASLLLADSALQDGDTLVTGLYGPAGVTTNQYVNRKQVYDLLEGLSEATLFGSTNAHPVISTAGSLADVAPSPAWSVTNAALAAGDTLVGAFWYTNSTDMIRAGTYIGRFYAVKSGTKTVTGKIALVYTDDNGATTNVIDTSAVSGAIGTSLASYRVTTHNDNNISGAGLYWGVLYYLTVSGSGTAPTVITYGGDPYDTHLETPGVGSLMGYVQTNDTTYTQTVALAASASQPGHAHAIADVTNAPAGFYPSNTATVTWSPIATNATTGLVTWQATGSAGASVVAGSGITVTTNGTEYTVAQSVTPTITAGTSITITTNSAQDWTIASTATGGGSQTPWTNNVDGGGYSLSGVNQLTLTNATLALTVPMGAAIRWYTDTTNYVDMKALSLGFMHFLSCSNGAIVTNIMQVNP